MKIKDSYIYINNVRVHAFHGVLPQEREVGQDFLVTLRCGVNFDAAMRHDMIEVAADYSCLYSIIREEMAVASQLLEHVAGRIAQRVLNDIPQVTTVDLWLTKENPPLGADCDGAGVELHVER